MWIDDKIILLRDVSAPTQMVGEKGQVKVVGKDINLYYAKRLVKGKIARQVEDDQIQDVLIELGLAEPEPKSAVKKKTRKEKTNGRGTDSERDKKVDTGKEG